MSRNRISALVFTLGGVATLAIGAAGSSTATAELQAAPVTAPGERFVETFDLDPSSPVNFADTSFADRWHVTQIITDFNAWENGTAVDAQHGSDCSAPPATHRADTWDEYVYICKNHLMTARATGAYAATYLMPLSQVDLSGSEAVISWDVSTLSMSKRDWIDMWVTPMDDLLMVPIDDWGPTLQGRPKNGIHVRNGNGSENWTIDVIRDLQVVGSAELILPYDFDFSARVRTPMTLRITDDEVTFTMEGVGTKTVPMGPGFDRGMIQWAQHSYNPTKDGVAATWHWDSFAFEPTLPLGVTDVSPVRSVANPGQTRAITFDEPAVDGDLLLFDAVCKVELDFGSGFQLVQKQPASKGNSVVEAQSSYRVPVPVGATGAQVRFQGDGWYDGWPCVFENPIIVNEEPADGVPATVPAQVARPTAAVNDGQVELSWVAPDDGGSTLTDYDVLMRVDGAFSWVDGGTSTATDLVVSGLDNGVQHEFWVRAENAVGVGPLSAKVIATPSALDRPAQVARPTALAGDGNVTLTWSPPDDGGSPITDYDVLMRADGVLSWVDGPAPSTQTQLTVTGLTNGTSHEFWVRAVNAVGTGMLSPKVVTTPSP